LCENIQIFLNGEAQNALTPHGFLSTASTTLNENGFDPDAIKAALVHLTKKRPPRLQSRAPLARARQHDVPFLLMSRRRPVHPRSGWADVSGAAAKGRPRRSPI
jgi:hypothetical protein